MVSTPTKTVSQPTNHLLILGKLKNVNHQLVLLRTTEFQYVSMAQVMNDSHRKIILLGEASIEKMGSKDQVDGIIQTPELAAAFVTALMQCCKLSSVCVKHMLHWKYESNILGPLIVAGKYLSFQFSRYTKHV